MVQCQQDAGPAQDGPRPFQFALSKLLLLVAACSLVFAVVAWGRAAMSGVPDAFAESHAAEAFLILGLGVLALGCCLRKWVLILLGAIVLAELLAGVVGFAGRPDFKSNLWVEEVVGFRVIDKETGEPVSGAVVRLVSHSSQQGLTSTDGYVRLRGEFDQFDLLLPFDFSGDQPDYTGCTVEVEGYAPLSCPPLDLPVDEEGRWIIQLPVPSGSSGP